MMSVYAPCLLPGFVECLQQHYCTTYRPGIYTTAFPVYSWDTFLEPMLPLQRAFSIWKHFHLCGDSLLIYGNSQNEPCIKGELLLWIIAANGMATSWLAKRMPPKVTSTFTSKSLSTSF